VTNPQPNDPELVKALASAIDARLKHTLPATNRKAVPLDEAARLMGVSRDTFDKHIRPEIRMLEIGSKPMVPLKELDRYIERNASRVVA